MTTTTKAATQNKQILNHLHNIGPLTPGEALVQYGCFRLAARIFELRKAGERISTSTVKNTEGNHYARYYIVKYVTSNTVGASI